MPVAPFLGGAQDLYFAHFGEGEDLLFSEITLFNLDPEEDAIAKIQIKDDQGDFLSVDLNGELVSGEKEIMIKACDSLLLRTDGQGPVQSGSVRVTSDQPLAGVILFGGSIGVAGVGSSGFVGEGLVAFVESNQAESGIAVMNLEAASQTLTFDLFDIDCNAVANTESELAAMGHLAKFLGELFPDVDLTEFRGLLKMTAPGKLAATVLQTRTEPNQLATMPVAPLLN